MSRVLRSVLVTTLVGALGLCTAHAASAWQFRRDTRERLGRPGTFRVSRDLERPAEVSLFTVSRDSARVQLDWMLPDDPAVAGVLVFASLVPVEERPIDGRRYRPFVVQGQSVAVCVSAPGELGCRVDIPPTGLPVDSVTFHVRAFTFDGRYIYSEGTPTTSAPLVGPAQWSYTTTCKSMQPAGTLPGKYVLGTGDDGLLHRVHTATGLRTGWTPIVLPAQITSRVLAGDFELADNTAYASAANGKVYRFSLDDGTSGPEATAHAIAEAGCSTGTVSAGPVAILDAYDANAIGADDAIIVTTNCGLTDNKVFSYPLGLGTATGWYNGGPDGLGAVLATPRVLYRDDGPNLVYVGVRDDGGESLVVLEVGPGGTLLPYASVIAIGDVETTPVTFRRTATDALVAVGATSGTLHLFHALDRTNGQLKPLDAIPLADGSVRGVAVSTRIPVAGGYENWVVWSTDSEVHGVKVRADGTFDTTTLWSQRFSNPSGPVVLRNVYVTGDTMAFFGTSNGRLFGLNATNGNTVDNLSVSPGKRLTEPTFDYGDGITQGLALTGDSGGIYWMPLVPAALESYKPPIEEEK